MEQATGIEALYAQLSEGEQRYLFLDYDGTLAPFNIDPSAVQLPARARAAVQSLTGSQALSLVLVTGRPRSYVEQIFRGLDFDMAAEHGLLYRERGAGEWQSRVPKDADPSSLHRYLPLLNEFVTRVPGTFVEEKELSITWHFRGASAGADIAAHELELELVSCMSPAHRLVRGKMNFEICLSQSDKGAFVRWYLEQHRKRKRGPGLVALGDDDADEGMFRIVTEFGGRAVKVGPGETIAQHRIFSPDEVCIFLEGIAHGLRTD